MTELLEKIQIHLDSPDSGQSLRMVYTQIKKKIMLSLALIQFISMQITEITATRHITVLVVTK